MKYLIKTSSLENFKKIYEFAKDLLRISYLQQLENDRIISMYELIINSYPSEAAIIRIDSGPPPEISYCQESYYRNASVLYTGYELISDEEFINQYINNPTIINESPLKKENNPNGNNNMPNKLKFKIGADPEFNIIMQDRKIPANDLMKVLMGKDLKLSDLGYNVKDAGEIGWDGASATGEIRPLPNNNIDQVIQNIKTLFSKFAEKSQLFELLTLSKAGSVGGHIHLEFEERPSDKKIRILDKILASFYIPLMLGENSTNLKARLNMGYGKITDYRVDRRVDKNDMKESYVLEFRAPSAEWITTEKIAKATLAYFATIWHQLNYRLETFKEFKEILLTNDKQADAMQQLALSKFVFLTKALYKIIKPAISKFELYPVFKEEIDYILNYSKVLKDKEKVGFNILRGWNLLQNLTPPTKKELTNEKRIKSRLKEINMDVMNELIRLNHTDGDTNIKDFVRALTSRIAAFNWKLKNQYTFFGLRKGIENYIIADCSDRFYFGKEQIKTKADEEAILYLLDKLENRFIGSRSNLKKMKKEELESKILFGIPYKERIEMNTKEFINLIHLIEKGKLIPSKINSSKLQETELENPGKIHEILSNNPDNSRGYFDPLDDLSVQDAQVSWNNSQNEEEEEELTI